MSRGGQIAAGVVLAAFGTLLALAVLEVGVRALHLVPSRFWQYDETLGTRLIPGMRGWWTQEEHEFIVPVQINSHGLRDVERSLAKPTGVERVLLIGDSHVEALQVTVDESIGRQLESRLRAKGRKVEVVSAGVSGYGTASEYLFFRERGWKFEPDLVVLAFYPGNDVKNNGAALETSLVPEYAEDGALVRVRGGKSRPPARRRSHAYTYLRKLILTRQPALAARLHSLGLIKGGAIRKAAAPEGVPLDYWVYAQPPPPEWASAWRRTERLLDDFHGAVQARGATFALVIVTARDHLYPESWQQVREAYPRLGRGEWDLEAPAKRILAWCGARRVACKNLHPDLARVRDGGAPRLHFVHDGHWTPAGHAAAAESVAAFIFDESLL